MLHTQKFHIPQYLFVTTCDITVTQPGVYLYERSIVFVTVCTLTKAFSVSTGSLRTSE